MNEDWLAPRKKKKEKVIKSSLNRPEGVKKLPFCYVFFFLFLIESPNVVNISTYSKTAEAYTVCIKIIYPRKIIAYNFSET